MGHKNLFGVWKNDEGGVAFAPDGTQHKPVISLYNFSYSKNNYQTDQKPCENKG